MASDKLLSSNFDWGDAVLIKSNAPKHFRPGSKGSICGMRLIESVEIAKEFNQPVKSELFLVEFSDGESIEIPKAFLTHLYE